MRGDQSHRMLGASKCPGLTRPLNSFHSMSQYQQRNGTEYPAWDCPPYHGSDRKTSVMMEAAPAFPRYDLAPRGGQPSAVHYARQLPECMEPSGCCPPTWCQCMARPHGLSKEDGLTCVLNNGNAGALNLTTNHKHPSAEQRSTQHPVSMENGIMVSLNKTEPATVTVLTTPKLLSTTALTVPVVTTSSPALAAAAATAAAAGKRGQPAPESTPPGVAMGPQQPMSPQQMQQMLQQQVLAPGHLQHIMTHQSLLMQQQSQHKLHDQVLVQLNEQLQMNVLQQAQLAQSQTTGQKGDSKQLQQQQRQLQLQQQQLVTQIQQVQRQFLLAQSIMGVPSFPNQQGLSLAEFQQIWKELTSPSQPPGGEGMNCKSKMNGHVPTPSLAHLQMLQSPGLSNGIHEGLLNPAGATRSLASPPNSENSDKSGVSGKKHSLYGHGVCKWPGCDSPCEDINAFQKHLDTDHQLDDRSTAQARVQMQVVNQLELQLRKERERLQAMMEQLHMRQEDTPNGPVVKVDMSSVSSAQSSCAELKTVLPKPPHVPLPPHGLLHLPPPGVSLPLPIPPPPLPIMSSAPATPHTPISPSSILPNATLTPSASLSPQTPCSGPGTPRMATGNCTPMGPMRRRVSDKCNLPISAEIQRNRDFYKSTDVRPPFTYASLIRQAIVESPDKQLSLNEIYQWFQATFAFFRKNQATWKAINESPNRQLTLNEIYMWLQHNFAYFRRNEATWKNAVRHNLSLHKCFMRVENVKGAVWTVDEVEFYKRRPQKLAGNVALKGGVATSPAPNHVLFGESLNASLRAALAESNLPILGNHSINMDYEESEYAEDLSLSRQPSVDQDSSDIPEGPEDLSNDTNDGLQRSSDSRSGTDLGYGREAEAALCRLRADQEASMAQFPLPHNGTPSPPSSALNGDSVPQFSTRANVTVSHVNDVPAPLSIERTYDVPAPLPGDRTYDVPAPLQSDRNGAGLEQDISYDTENVMNIVPMGDSDVMTTTEDSESMDVVHSNAEHS